MTILICRFKKKKQIKEKLLFVDVNCFDNNMLYTTTDSSALCSIPINKIKWANYAYLYMHLFTLWNFERSKL